MFITAKPDLTKIKLLDTSNLQDGQGGVENQTTTQLPPNFSDSFETIAHPSAVDKMLLPASPGLDHSAVQGNFEKQKQKQILDEKAMQMLDHSAAEGNFEKQKQILDAKQKQILPPGIDKMLLPAAPSLDNSAVEKGIMASISDVGSENQLQMMNAQNEKGIVVQSEKEKELKISEDERLEQVLDSRRLTNLKI